MVCTVGAALRAVVAVHKVVHMNRCLVHQVFLLVHGQTNNCYNTSLFAAGAFGCRYGEYEDLRKLVHRTLRRTERILVIGCGNSNFSAELYDDGFEEVRLATVKSMLWAT